MANITVNMTTAEAESALTQLRTFEAEIVAELERVRGNIKALATFLAPIIYPIVKRVQGDSGAYYTIKFFGQQDYTCECMSYRYMSGLDVDGNCKHIRKAVDEGYFA